MRYLALACDYDGTLASYGTVDNKTLAALKQVRDSGRKLLLVTGRRLDDLLEIFPDAGLFDRIVAENGALLYNPATREERLLGKKPPEEFIDQLLHGGAKDVAVGKVIVATWEPYESVALAAIRDLGLELQVIFNKGAVMILPSGVNKATGMAEALADLSLSAHNVVGIGDAENDHAFLSACGCSVAVANALDTLKERVDWVVSRDHSDGVQELIEALIRSDLSDVRGLTEEERQRRRRKYTEGELSPDLSFFFRGPGNRLNLRAQNLTIFMQIADGVDDETWLFHLRHGDVSRWFRDVLKDAELTSQTKVIEQDQSLTAAESRRRVKAAIQQRYTIAA